MSSEMLLESGKGEWGKEMLAAEDLTQRIIGAAISVHRTLGSGFLESIYEEALCVELEASGLLFERQRSVPIFYRGRSIGEHRLNLLVQGEVIVELKAVKAIEPIHFAIVRSYLKALNLDAALLLNFSTSPMTIRRAGRELPGKEGA